MLIRKEPNVSQGYLSVNSFQYLLNPIGNCRLDTYNTERHSRSSILKNIDTNLLDLTDPSLTKILLFGGYFFETNVNITFLNATIEYVLSIERFDSPLFH